MRGIINIISGFLPPVVSAMVGLILTPLILSRLGLETYSYWPLCNSLTLYVGLVTMSLGMGLRRQTVFALDRGDLEGAREYFQTGLTVMLAFWLLVVLTGFLISPRLSLLVQVKPELQSDVQRMFLFITFSVSLSIPCAVFFIGAYARDRLYTEKMAGVASTLLRLLIIFMAFAIWVPSLAILGISSLMGTLFTLLIAIVTFFRYLPMVGKFHPKYITGRAMRSVTGFGGWVLCSAVGFYFFQSLSLLLANRLVGPAEAGRFGVILQVTTVVTASIGHICYVLSRRLIALISRGDVGEAEISLRKYYAWTMGAFSLPIAFLFVHADMLFVFWLGDYGESLGDLLRIGLMVVFLIEPMAMVNVRLLASNRVALNGLASLLMGPALVGFAFALAKGLDWGVAGIITASGFALLGRNVTLLIDTRRTCRLPLSDLARGFVVGLLAFGGVVLISYGRTRIMPLPEPYGFFWDSILGTGVWAVVLWKFSADCRNLAQSLIRRFTMNEGGYEPR